MLGYSAESLEIGDLPIVSFDMRATHLFRKMRDAMKNIKPTMLGWKPKPGSGWQVGIRLIKLNSSVLISQITLAAMAAVLFYVPAFFLRRLVAYLEADPGRLHRGWGIVYALGLFIGGVVQTLGEYLCFRPARFGRLTPLLSDWSTLVYKYHNPPSQVSRAAQFHLVCQNIGSEGPRFHRVK